VIAAEYGSDGHCGKRGLPASRWVGRVFILPAASRYGIAFLFDLLNYHAVPLDAKERNRFAVALVAVAA